MEILMYAKFLVLIFPLLILSCASNQVQELNQNGNESEVTVISECNAKCKSAIKREFGLRVNTISERLNLNIGSGWIINMPVGVRSVNGSLKEYNNRWSGEVYIPLARGKHEFIVKQIIRGYSPKVKLSLVLERGLYGLSMYMANLGYTTCWTPFVYEYETDKVIYPRLEQLQWQESVPNVDLPGAPFFRTERLSLKINGVPDEPRRCSEMPQVLKDVEETLKRKKQEIEDEGKWDI